jgi:hypothetical protein
VAKYRSLMPSVALIGHLIDGALTPAYVSLARIEPASRRSTSPVRRAGAVRREARARPQD